MPLISSRIHAFIDRLTAFIPDVGSVWLMGSRANKTFREDSDWDFLIFGSRDVLEAIRADISHRRSDVHLFVVTDGNCFESVWPRDGVPECDRGRLKGSPDASRGLWVCGWCWRQISPTEARYITPLEPEPGRKLQAFRVYPD